MSVYLGVKVRIAERGPAYWFRNVTEIHMRPDLLQKGKRRIAFESDVHGTGADFDLGQVQEFETSPETEEADNFFEY